jgi:hypothetical protein
VDVYSFGVVLWEICTGRVPTRGRLADPEVPGDCPADILMLIRECMQVSSAQLSNCIAGSGAADLRVMPVVIAVPVTLRLSLARWPAMLCRDWLLLGLSMLESCRVPTLGRADLLCAW